MCNGNLHRRSDDERARISTTLESAARMMENLLAASLADRYTIGRELGAGGMATVYLAHDIKHDRDVAIKVLHADLGAALGAERFLSEIRTTARLQHPHILPLLDSGDADGLLYYVMPLVTGETLRARLERERQLPIDDAVLIAREVADALGYAHGLGVIHRDIKPENILLQGGHALVADFGIALAVQSAGGARMTQTGLSLGTPQYMSPEQAMGERTIDARSDIYALGAVTYEMLTGDPPFTGSSVQAIVAKVMTERPTPPHVLRDTIPPSVEHAVLTALAKLPADRYATAAEFATALARPGDLRSSTPRSHGVARRSQRGTMLLGALALFASIAALWGWLRGTRSSEPVTRIAMEMNPGQEVRPQFYGFAIAVSHDGSRLAYIGAGSRPGETQLYVRRLDALDASVVPGTAGATSVEWSPDGRSLLIGVSSGVGLVNAIVPLDGGQVIPLPGAREATWGAGGAIYYAPRGGGGIVVRRELDGKLDTLPKVRLDSGYADRPLTIFPNERGLLWEPPLASPDDTTPQHITAISFATGQSSVISAGVYARLLPSGELLRVADDGGVFVEPFDAKRLQVTGREIALARVALGSNSANRIYPQISMSDNGTLVYIAGTLLRDQLVWLAPDGRRIGPTDVVGPVWGFALSPDGSRVAFAKDSRGTDPGVGNKDIWVENLANAARTRLTNAAINLRPSWSADGKYVLWSRIGGPARQSAMERPADASAPERMVLARSAFRHSIGDVRWLPDHRTLLAGTYGDEPTGRDLFTVIPGDSTSIQPVAAMRDNQSSGIPSPDGTLIAYNSDETGTRELYVQPMASTAGRIRISTGGASAGRWSRDGKSLYYWDQRGKLVVVSIQTRPALAVSASRDFGGTAVLSTGGGQSSGLFDIAPDGRVLMAEDVPGSFQVILVRNWAAGLANAAAP
jgi:serine/threonine-protein kinase